MKKDFKSLIWILVVALVFYAGFLFGQENIPSIEKVHGLSSKEITKPDDVDFSLFWDTWSLVEKKYIERNDLDRQQMVYGAIAGMLGALEDPYSVFMAPEQSKMFLEDISGSFDGIGAEVGIRGGLLTVISPLEGNPAQKAGLRAGDKILKVDDDPTTDLTLDEAVRLIRGEKGTPVLLLVARDEWDEAKEIEIVRDSIKIPVINLEMKEDNIVYIQLFHFTENIGYEFAKIVSEVVEKNPRGIVLDLRNNPGGYLEMAVNVASWFLPKGELIVVEDFGEENGEKNNEFRSRGYEDLENTPTIVLVNEGSASAAEIVAGALKDIRGIQIVGKQSFGKGSVQQLEKMKDGSSVKITVAKWLTPSGISISDEGIKPDFEVEITEEDIENLRDPQLEKALELFNN